MSQYKVCPQCMQPAELAAASCQHCGHQYRTQFDGNNAPTQAYGTMPTPPPPYQPPHSNYSPILYQQPIPTDAIIMPPGAHSVAIAVLLSLFCSTFAGHLYNRQYAKAFVMLAVKVTLMFVTMGLSLLVTTPLFLVDTIMIANRLNRGEPVGQWQFF